MRRAQLTQGGGAAPVPFGPGALRSWALTPAAADELNAVGSWLMSFAVVLILAGDSGGYWPTAWDWTALVMLFVCALALVLKAELTLMRRELLLPAGLLALTGWGVLSAAWSPSLTEPLLQSQRTLAYAATVFAALLVVRSRSYRALIAGVWAAVTLTCCYSLLTRLFPERYGFVDSIAGYRLEAPIGYWNALGVFAAIGTLIALGLTSRAQRGAMRTLAATSIVVLVPTLYFTFSRGAWLSLGIGVVAMVALDGRRLQLVTSALCVAPFPALALWLASRSAPLTHVGGGLAAAEHVGHRYIIDVAILCGISALATSAYLSAERRVNVPAMVRRMYAWLLVAIVIAGCVAVTVRFGSPSTIARKAYDSLIGPARGVTNGNLNTRLDSLGLGQRIPQWQVAWHEYLTHPWLGSGLGSYTRYWNEYRPQDYEVVNVHNLYLETLAELGPLGLALLLLALALPFLGLARARRHPLVSAAGGAYIAFLAHCAVDWDWQLPAVTLAALFCGIGVALAARPESPRWLSLRTVPRAGALILVVALGAAAFVALRGNDALATGQLAATNGDWTHAASDARAAAAWAPWSAEPWALLGEAQQGLGERAAARASYEQSVTKDPSIWSTWLDLAIVSHGVERASAFARASLLNPLAAPQIAAAKSSSGGLAG